jgi:hypothetical protein
VSAEDDPPDEEPCVVCGKKVAKGEGAQAIPPFPALHSRCLKAAMAKLDRP